MSPGIIVTFRLAISKSRVRFSLLEHRVEAKFDRFREERFRYHWYL